LNEKIILGIDPGTTTMGYGIIKVVGKNPEMLAMGILQLHKYEDHMVKLQVIFRRCVQLIEEYTPDELAIEAPFFGKNVQSMLKLGRAQGVALAAAVHLDIPVTEYAPRKIKQSITGNGNASKEQVAGMLANILKISIADMEVKDDATDGLAVALCHYYQLSQPGAALGGAKSWKAFIAQNKGRVK
jgi:crossover junction endodeoxyribonuclease RuvC